MQLLYPPHISLGWQSRHELAGVLASAAGDADARYVLVTGRSARYEAIAAELAQTLGPAAHHASEIDPEPTLAHGEALLSILREARAEAVIAVGGGSVIDVAKAAAVVAPAPGTVADYFHERRSISQRGLPLLALPTTAGTGAEITKNAVLTDPESQLKKSIRHPQMVPAAAVIDPELTVSAPPEVTAASGLDAFTQALESYLCTRAHAVSRALAAEAMQLIWHNLPTAWADGSDRPSRERVAEGSLLSAMAFSQSGLGAVHGLAHPIGALLHVAHGLTCAILLPPVLRFNQSTCGEALTRLAPQLGCASADELVEAVAAFVRQLRVPKGFGGHGLGREHFDFIVAHCRSNSMASNPRPMTDADVRALLTVLVD
jgi:alcohol dehydrogenase class IV